MFHVRKGKRKVVRITKAKQEVLDRLQSFLERESEEPIQLLERTWKDQQNALTYQELRNFILKGDLDEGTFSAWQQDYSRLTEEHMNRWWKKAMDAGATGQTLFAELRERGVSFHSTSKNVVGYLQKQGGEFITKVTNEQRGAIKGLLIRSVVEGHSIEELARVIRPCIGLNARQAAANVKYYDHVKDTLSKTHPGMKLASREAKAREAAVSYAGRQHRYRAQMIAQTELAYAYNHGAEEAAVQVYEKGLLGKFERIWCTAANENVCDTCKDLDGTKVGSDTIPPLHPFCACAIQYVEIELPKYPPFNTLREVDFLEIQNTDILSQKAQRDLNREIGLISPIHRGIITSELKSLQIIEQGNSRFDQENGIMYLRNDFEEGEAIHEMAHVIETSVNLWANSEFIGIVNQGLEDVSLGDIVYVPDEYSKIVYFATNSKFVSEYQGRLYEEAPFFDSNEKLNPYALGEYFSEGYKFYVLHPDTLKEKDLPLYNFIDSFIGGEANGI